ncbi:hypothetical protein K1T71_014254 [Dendrolimus kikuchii]|uniref:Uncharacterized protein n=1 Tax=Dendrolimus kikuchii TaxID=765133 RepID=A0ACC1CFI6_9NEOP|nr:hypothetical protein K1T71_014254 [Dendrolimus kikuchii]
MAVKVTGVICFVLYLLQLVSAQCINRVLPSQNILPVGEAIIPNQLLLNQQFIPTSPNLYNIDVPLAYDYTNAIPTMPTTTIIQDSTVSNNLANALQLLVVSNLLRNTLYNDDMIPNYAPIDIPIGNYGYNYVY